MDTRWGRGDATLLLCVRDADLVRASILTFIRGVVDEQLVDGHVRPWRMLQTVPPKNHGPCAR